MSLQFADVLAVLVIVSGLVLFETVSSIDNAIINAQVLSTMGRRARWWFLSWGLLIAVFGVRGFLPWLIVWGAIPALGPAGALTATFSSDPQVLRAVEAAAPLLLIGGGTFLVFLFLSWLFLEQKHYALVGERFIHGQGVWFYAVVSFGLSALVWVSLQVNDLLAFGAVLGSTAFFITHGFRENAEKRMVRTIFRRWHGTLLGVTAGASAPEILVQEVVAQLKLWGATVSEEMPGVEENIVFALPKTLRDAKLVR